MSTHTTHPVVIVGGGISGLTCAYRLKQADVPFVLLEASDRIGGMLRTERVDGYTLEYGADAILTRKPWARQLAAELGLDVLPINKPPRSTYVLHRGETVPLPDGLALLAPSNWPAFLRSRLFTPAGKLRAAIDLFIPRRCGAADETLADFVTRRLGREMLDTVGDPMLAGVFNGESHRQSMLATFPQFPALEREYGSLIRGVRAKQREAKPSEERPFFSFARGVQSLPEAIAAHVWHGFPTLDSADAKRPTRVENPCHEMRTNTAVARVERDGDGFRVILATGETIAASAVIIATPAHVAATTLRDLAPTAAAALASIRYTGIGTAYVAYRREDVPHALDGFGVVIPCTERRAIDGMMWSTTKWKGRAPAGQALVRVFFGGPHTRHVLDYDDARLQQIVRAELAEILGVTAEPLLWRCHRWSAGYPQYDLGHLDRVATIDRELPPGVVVTGNAYRGVGVPDCVRQANETAAKVIAFLKEPAK